MLSLRRRIVIAGVTAVLAIGGIVLGGTAAGAALPGNVTNVHTTNVTGSSVTLNWTNPTTAGFKGVHICRAPGTTVPASSCSGVNVGKTKTSYTDTFQLSPNTQYTYGLFAYNLSGKLASGASVTVTTGPAGAPLGNVTNLHTTAVTSSEIDLAWTNPASPDFAGVYICRAQGTTAPTLPCGGVTVAGTPSGTSSYNDTTQLLPGTTYTYTVFSSDAAGNPSSGTSLSVQTAAGTAPGNVTGLTATPSAAGASPRSVVLNWTAPASSNYAGVYICRAFGTTAPTLPCAGVTVSAAAPQTYTDSYALAANTTYTYSVWASDAAGDAASGATVQVTTNS